MMMDQTGSSFHIPQKLGRIVLLALEEIIARNGVNAILNQANLSHLIENYPPDSLERQFGFNDLSAIQISLEQIYGARGGRGIALRAGRVCFKYGLREFCPDAISNNVGFRLAPIETKINKGAQILAQFFNQNTDQLISIENQPDSLLFKIEHCPICWGRSTSTPVCHMMVGLVQEGLYWLGGGKFFTVEETSCTAKGDPFCTIMVDKHVID